MHKVLVSSIQYKIHHSVLLHCRVETSCAEHHFVTAVTNAASFSPEEKCCVTFAPHVEIESMKFTILGKTFHYILSVLLPSAVAEKPTRTLPTVRVTRLRHKIYSSHGNVMLTQINIALLFCIESCLA